MITYRTAGRGKAFCRDCPWTSDDYIKALTDAQQHAAKAKHDVDVAVVETYSVYWKRFEADK